MYIVHAERLWRFCRDVLLRKADEDRSGAVVFTAEVIRCRFHRQSPCIITLLQLLMLLYITWVSLTIGLVVVTSSSVINTGICVHRWSQQQQHA